MRTGDVILFVLSLKAAPEERLVLAAIRQPSTTLPELRVVIGWWNLAEYEDSSGLNHRVCHLAVK